MFTTFAPRAIASASVIFYPGKTRRAARRRGDHRHYIWFGSIAFWLILWYFVLVAVGLFWLVRLALWIVTVVLILVAQLVWWIFQSPWVLFREIHDHSGVRNRPARSVEGWAQERWEDR